MKSKASLHPDRIESAIDWLVDHHGDAGIPIRALDTCLAALRLVQKVQARAGLTAGVVDALGHTVALVDYVKRAIPRK